MKIKNMTLRLSTTMIIVATILLASCGGRTNKKTHVGTTSEVTSSVINYPLPTAYEVTNLINRTGTGFVIGITNPASKVENYLSETDKALNLGVYGADLAYVSTYNMKQETMDYMKALKKLVDDLHVSTNFNTELARKVEGNLDNKDSLITIISQSFHDTYSFLVNNGKDDMSIMVLVGTWVEGLYITAMATNTSSKPTEMLQVMTNQKNSLNTLVTILDKNVQSPEIAKLRQLIDPIVVEYSKVKDKVTPEQSLVMEGKIEKIRTAIVK